MRLIMLIKPLGCKLILIFYFLINFKLISESRVAFGIRDDVVGLEQVDLKQHVFSLSDELFAHGYSLLVGLNLNVSLP